MGRNEKETDCWQPYGVGCLLDRQTYVFAIYILVCIFDLDKDMASKLPVVGHGDDCERSLVQRQKIINSTKGHIPDR